MPKLKMGRVSARMKSVKGKRWKKGQSSSSNPQTNKHRTAARGKFSGHLAQTHEAALTLTTDALASHDAIQGERDEIQPSRFESLCSPLQIAQPCYLVVCV